MRSIRRLFTAATFLLLAACSPRAQQMCEVEDGGLDAGDNWALGFIGEELHLHSVSPGADCREPVELFVDVVGPSTTSSPVTIVQSTHRPDGRLEVEFSFTPTEPGLYQVNLTFQPDLGRKRGHIVVPELAMGAWTPVSTGMESCDEVSRLADAFLCVSGTSASIWKAGQAVSRFQGKGVTVGGDAIWSVSPGGFVLRRDNAGNVTNISSQAGFTGDLGFCEDVRTHGYRFDGNFLQELSPSIDGLDVAPVSRIPNIACWYDNYTYGRVTFGGVGGGIGGDLAAGLTGEAVWLVTGTGYSRPLKYEPINNQLIDPSGIFHLDLPSSGAWAHRAHWPVWEVAGFALAPVLTPTPHWEAWPEPLLGIDDDVVFLPGAAPGEVLMVRRPGR